MRLATFPKNTSFGSFLPPIDFVLFGPPLHSPFLYVCSYSQAATISRQVVKSIICYSNSCNTPEVCRLFHSESTQSINCTLVNNCSHLRRYKFTVVCYCSDSSEVNPMRQEGPSNLVKHVHLMKKNNSCAEYSPPYSL